MFIKPVTFQVLQIGGHWEVTCSLRDRPHASQPDRRAAIRAAEAAALALWKRDRVATEVVVNEDDGRWHAVARFGDLLD